LPAWPKLQIAAPTYLTFVAANQRWTLRVGVGIDGPIAAAINGAPVRDLSAPLDRSLWLLLAAASGSGTDIVRLSIPRMETARVAPPPGRLDRLAVTPAGTRIAALELPSGLDDLPRLWLGEHETWRPLSEVPTPDISSHLAWLDQSRLAMESSDRRLCVVNVDSGQSEIGPPGCCMAAATLSGSWYALVDGQVAGLPIQAPFENPRFAPEGFSFASVSSLHVTQDGRVFTWTEPLVAHRLRAYVQEQGRKRMRVRDIEQGSGAVIGPVS
jgi:hypothetical protein